MKIPHKLNWVIGSAFLTLFTAGSGLAQQPMAETNGPATDVSSQIRLKLKDGTSLSVDEAAESEQGIWYRQGGVSHLISRDRVKTIDRGVASKPGRNQVAKVVEIEETPKPSEQPVWIYLKGGARVEADSAIESAAGVWYRRGSLTIFVDRSRIDRVEREDLETLAESNSSRKERGWTTGNARIDSLIRLNGAKHGVDPYLIFCVMEQESHFNARALSPKGARGLMQLMPGTAARFGVRNSSDPAQNIAGGTRYLKQLIGQFDGRIDLVLASYNAGEGAVLKFGRKVPPYRETRDYVKRISYRYRRARPVERAKNSVAVVTAAGL
ncbi:MAG TPA: lytic transglycosylase domain-containing protein [Pyrinomonadaceae bacterium]|nr:lytic transglycosylase domain-containing protein [Pyrinomonadaceae bacterium]